MGNKITTKNWEGGKTIPQYENHGDEIYKTNQKGYENRKNKKL